MISSPPIRPSRPLSTTPFSVLSCIRFGEVLVLQGSPLLGALFALDRLMAGAAGSMALLAAGNCCLVAHVFVVNDWSGIYTDLKDPNRVGSVFVNRGVTRSSMGLLSLVLLALGLMLFGAIGLSTMLIASVIAGLSALYSWPRTPMKGVPVLSSALHFAGGLLHFLLGYSVFSHMDRRGLEIGCFFALLFVAGHLTHETRDREADSVNGIRTNAVAFGKKCSFLAAVTLFGVAGALMVALSLLGRVPPLLIAVGALFPLHLYWAAKVLRKGLDFESVAWLQRRYRLLYAAVGILMAVALFRK